MFIRTGGKIIAACQNLEFAWETGQASAQILLNLIPWATQIGQDWLSASPSEGSLPPGQSLNIEVGFATGTLGGGIYHGSLQILSDDPQQPEVDVPAQMQVVDAPDITVTPGSIDFGTVGIGVPSSRSVVVANTGAATLTVSAVTAAPGEFTADGTGFNLGAGESRTVVVTFAPVASGPAMGSMSLSSNDPDEPVLALPLAGSGVLTTGINAAPPSLGVSASAGSTATTALTISNAADVPISFRASGLRTVQRTGRCRGLRAVATGYSNGQIAVVDLNSGQVGPFLPGIQGIADLAFEPGHSEAVWAVNSREGKIQRIDLSTGAITRTVGGLRGPYALAIDPVRPIVYVVQAWGDGEIVAVDLETGLSTPIAAGFDSVQGIEVNGAGTRIHVVDSWNGRVLSIDPATGAQATIVSGLEYPRGLALSPDEKRGYFIDGGTGLLQEVDWETGLLSRVTAGVDGVSELAISPAGDRFYFLRGQIITEYDPATGEVTPLVLDMPMAMHFEPVTSCQAEFIFLTPSEATVPPHGAVTLGVGLDASAFDEGTYQGAIEIASDDPLRPLITVPVTLEALGLPAIEVEGREMTVEAAADFTSAGATTSHHLPVTGPAPSGEPSS